MLSWSLIWPIFCQASLLGVLVVIDVREIRGDFLHGPVDFHGLAVRVGHVTLETGVPTPHLDVNCRNCSSKSWRYDKPVMSTVAFTYTYEITRARWNRRDESSACARVVLG